MIIDVSDVRSSPNDQIYHVAKVLGRSKDRKKVFLAIYKGKKKIKTVSELVGITKLKRIRVLQEANILAGNKIIKKTKFKDELAYEKDQFYSQNKKKILSLAENKSKLKSFPTKIHPQIETKIVNVSFPQKIINISQITIDDIDTFSQVRKIIEVNKKHIPYSEEKIKEGFKKVLGEEGDFIDWGGEKNDLFTTRLKINRKRIVAVFGFKGKGTKGILTPKKMGKNADQIQRLFQSNADCYMIQYWGQINESILDQMKSFAIAKSVTERRKIFFGIIDGKDTRRLILAYPEYFKPIIEATIN